MAPLVASFLTLTRTLPPEADVPLPEGEGAGGMVRQAHHERGEAHHERGEANHERVFRSHFKVRPRRDNCMRK